MAFRSLIGAAILATALPVADARAQDHDQEERPITLVGCVMREHQYRDMYGPGLSGPRGAGLGGRNEFMLVDARELGAPEATAAANAAITPASDTTSCPPAPGTFPNAYELTGSREEEVAPFLGRRVEVTGIRKEAHAKPVGTAGILRPAGGFDPLGHELHLFEVEVEGVREARAFAAAPAPAEPIAAAPAPQAEPTPAPAPEPAQVAEAAPAPVEPEPAPAPPPATTPQPATQRVEVAPAPAPEPEPVGTTGAPEPPRQVAQAELPRSASPLPLMGLIGLLALAAGAGIRALRRHE